MPEGSRPRWMAMQERAITERRLLAVYDGAVAVAMARIMPFRQWWHGAALPMAGIAGVVVAPEHRGRGVGSRLTTATAARAVELGYPTSALHPATVPPYRSLGWELAGYRYFVTVPTEAVRTLARGDSSGVRRVDPGSAGDVLKTVSDVHERQLDNGPIESPEYEVAEWLRDDEPFAYLADDGFLAYEWDGNTLAVDTLVADSEQTARELWSIVGSGSSIASRIRANVPPDDPVRLLTREFAAATEQRAGWMLRLLDAPAAVAGRGFPRGVSIEVPLTVTDDMLPSNSGTWLLRVADGGGALVPHDRPGLELAAGGLAAMFAGTRVTTLRRAGLASGGDRQDDALLDTAFAATAFMLDHF
jgi:predicted acetyltransferase